MKSKKVLLVIGIVISLLLSFLFGTAYEESLRENEPKMPISLEEWRKGLKDVEVQNDSYLCRITGRWEKEGIDKGNGEKEFILHYNIISDACVASFKDFKIKMIHKTSTGTTIGESSTINYRIINPGETIKDKWTVTMPNNVDISQSQLSLEATPIY